MTTSTPLTTPSTTWGNVALTIRSQIGIPDLGYRKVFAIGLNKTGTSSIDRVLQDCGLVTTHSTGWRWRFSHLHWTRQGFSDGRPFDFSVLDRRFPGSKFILNTRDLATWIDSRIEHLRALGNGGTWSSADELGPKAVSIWVRRRTAYHARALRYFKDRPDNLLILNYIREADAPSRIRAFIGKPPKDAPKPEVQSMKSTARRKGTLSNPQIIAEALSSLGVMDSEWNNDLLVAALAPEGDLPLDTRDVSGTNEGGSMS